MKNARLFVGCCVFALMSGCASTPDVVYNYYPSSARTTVSVLQTVDCTADKTALIVLDTPSVVTAYAADYSRPPFSLRIKNLDGAVADSDVSFAFFDDGRLKTINASSQGQGEAVIKAAVSFATSIAALGGKPSDPKVTPPAIPECGVVADWGKDKPVTLSYSAFLDPPAAAEIPVPLEVSQSSKALYAKLKARLPKLQVQISQPQVVASGVQLHEGYDLKADKKAVPLTLQVTQNLKVEVLEDGNAIFTSRLTVPTSETYYLPLPKAAVFGKQSFSLTLSEAGAITAIDYGQLTGAAGPLNAATAAAAPFAGKSTADKAAELQAQADLIAQQQRLVRCQAHPDQCE